MRRHGDPSLDGVARLVSVRVTAAIVELFLAARMPSITSL